MKDEGAASSELIPRSDVSLEIPLAVGRTAEIYPWKDGQVLKLFREWAPASWVEYEARIGRAWFLRAYLRRYFQLNPVDS